MPHSLNSKYATFPKGTQRIFITDVLNRSEQNCNQLSTILKVSSRTIRDWHREKYTIPFRALRQLAGIGKVPIPKHFELHDRYAHVKAAGSKAGKIVMQKYGVVGGDPENRRRAWHTWWKTEGIQLRRHIFARKPIKKPKKGAELAEFVGIVLGDGGITRRQIVITLNSETDYEYSRFVVGLIKELFGVKVGLYKIKNALAFNVVVSRTELVDFCVSLGLKIGHKVRQQVDIPYWIKQRRSFMIACIRGLIDTDGSVFNHRYRVSGKLYEYVKMDFCSLSRPLLASVFNFLKSEGLKPRITKDGKKIRIESVVDIKSYFNKISSHNPKHLNRYGSLM